ncbi:Uncharacterised protein [uncultured archaeon]|nr:Uncharacterised protein [uncultured archaeon]
MSKDTSELLAECWQLLVDYIPHRDQSAAAEQFISYLVSILDEGELEAISELDGDLADAYQTISSDETEENQNEEDDE